MSQSSSKKVITKEEWEKKLSEVKIRKEDMNKLVMNFLVTEGYVEAAEKFQLESGTQRILCNVNLTMLLILTLCIYKIKPADAVLVLFSLCTMSRHKLESRKIQQLIWQRCLIVIWSFPSFTIMLKALWVPGENAFRAVTIQFAGSLLIQHKVNICNITSFDSSARNSRYRPEHHHWSHGCAKGSPMWSCGRCHRESKWSESRGLCGSFALLLPSSLQFLWWFNCNTYTAFVQFREICKINCGVHPTHIVRFQIIH